MLLCAIGKKIQELPGQVTACGDRGGAPGAHMKAINWVLLVIAWWKAHADKCDDYDDPAGLVRVDAIYTTMINAPLESKSFSFVLLRSMSTSNVM